MFGLAWGHNCGTWNSDTCGIVWRVELDRKGEAIITSKSGQTISFEDDHGYNFIGMRPKMRYDAFSKKYWIDAIVARDDGSRQYYV